MKFSLSLGGGGAKGAAHIGVLKALAEHGLYPSSISGTSIGGIVAGLYASGLGVEKLSDIVDTLQYTGKYLLDYNYSYLALGIIEAALKKEISAPGLIKGAKIFDYLDMLTDGRELFRALLPIAITSVDLNTGDTIVFHSHRQPMWKTGGIRYINNGKISTAMRASSAVPGIFSPLIQSGMMLTDGGVTTMLPVDLSFAMGETKVIAVDLGTAIQSPIKPYIIPIFSRTLNIMSFPTISPHNDGSLLIIKPPIPKEISLLDFENMNECLDYGYKETIARMPSILQMLQN